MASLAETIRAESAAQKARVRALIVPREHGAWGLLFVPLFTGLVAGRPSVDRVLSLALFTFAALALFWLRTPVESLMGASPVAARTPQERRLAWIASCALAAFSAACLAALLWNGHNSKLLWIGFAVGCALAAQAALRTLGRKTRMAAQLIGAIGLTATAPAAYFLGAGHLDSRAFVLWIANWLFAADQIHFVQLRIHAARAEGFRQRFAQGKLFLLMQTVMACALVIAASERVVSALVIVAFLPALYRGTRWFFRSPEPLDVKKLGWSEMRQGIAFGILLAAAFLFS